MQSFETYPSLPSGQASPDSNPFYVPATYQLTSTPPATPDRPPAAKYDPLTGRYRTTPPSGQGLVIPSGRRLSAEGVPWLTHLPRSATLSPSVRHLNVLQSRLNGSPMPERAGHFVSPTPPSRTSKASRRHTLVPAPYRGGDYESSPGKRKTPITPSPSPPSKLPFYATPPRPCTARSANSTINDGSYSYSASTPRTKYACTPGRPAAVVNRHKRSDANHWPVTPGPSQFPLDSPLQVEPGYFGLGSQVASDGASEPRPSGTGAAGVVSDELQAFYAPFLAFDPILALEKEGNHELADRLRMWLRPSQQQGLAEQEQMLVDQPVKNEVTYPIANHPGVNSEAFTPTSIEDESEPADLIVIYGETAPEFEALCESSPMELWSWPVERC